MQVMWYNDGGDDKVNFINEAVIGRSCFSGIAGKTVDDTKYINISVVDGMACSDYPTESECPASCYWYDGACHSKPKEEEAEIPWTIIFGAIGAVAALVAIAAFVKR